MTISELLNYIQENLNDGCLSLESEVYIRINWGDIHPVTDVKNDANQIYENAVKSLSKAIFCDKKLAENIKESGNYLINPL